MMSLYDEETISLSVFLFSKAIVALSRFLIQNHNSIHPKLPALSLSITRDIFCSNAQMFRVHLFLFPRLDLSDALSALWKQNLICLSTLYYYYCVEH